MRLLNSSKIELSGFYDDEIPEYAILSHTWQKGEEVSFQAFPKPESRTLAGYTKITHCCKLAVSAGIDYVWIDTCCIDKTSSAELSEAINSMYRWYRKAKICFIYLSDVLSADCREFERSRWFTRGWTLQELLASKIRQFYSSDWEELDYDLWDIARASGIRYDYLQNPIVASVAAKMSWASKRKTLRVEDEAYSLMGLFNVNMPLLYGEGRKAFLRLQYEIVKNVDDESIFAWKDSTLVESGMFALSPAAFVDSGDVQSMDFHYFHRPDTYSVTNRGLHIELMYRVTGDAAGYSKDGPFEVMPIHCATEAERDSQIAVVIRREAGGSFVRMDPSRLVLFDGERSYYSSSKSRKIYVRPSYLRSHGYFSVDVLEDL